MPRHAYLPSGQDQGSGRNGGTRVLECLIGYTEGNGHGIELLSVCGRVAFTTPIHGKPGTTCLGFLLYSVARGSFAGARQFLQQASEFPRICRPECKQLLLYSLQ